MILARVFTAAAGCVVLGAAVASCSGSFGSGSGLPNTLASPSFGGPSSAPTPATASSVILTYGELTSFQALPEVGGYAGSIAFPKAAEPTVAPAAKNKTPKKDASPEPSPTAVAVAIGATLSIVKPQDGPDLNFVSGKGKKKRNREQPARALAYITLLPTHDATLESYPRISIDIPREVASQYRDGEFGLALWNSGEKDAKYRLAVAEIDATSTPPPLPTRAPAAVAPASPGSSAKPGASPASSPSPATLVSTAKPGTAGSPVPGTSGNPGVAAPSAAPTLPPARLVFSGTATPLKLVANRPAIFALYALPHPSSSPAAKASVLPAASGSSAPVPAAASPARTSTPMPSAPEKTP
jgi:S-DNA-T family DNA segregation ATPase FtsK/SpoIIIE